MHSHPALALLALVAPALAHNTAAAPLISQISAALPAIPSLIESVGPALVTEISELIATYDPTGVVSDIPSLLSAGESAIETHLAAHLTEILPLPTELAAEVPAALSFLVPAAISLIDSAVSVDLPATLSLTAVPAILSGAVSEIATDVESFISAELPALSSFLATAHHAAGAAHPTGHWTTTHTGGAALPTGGSPSVSYTAPVPTTSIFPTIVPAAASSLMWQAEIAALAGLALAVVLL